jgi:Ulp1 family protease
VQPGEQQKLMKLLGKTFDTVVLDTFITGSNAKIFVSNLVCVCEGQWLNSETINVYVLMIEAAAKSTARNVASFSSYFVTKIETEVKRIVQYVSHVNVFVCDAFHQGHSGVKKWTEKFNKESKTLFDLDR